MSFLDVIGGGMAEFTLRVSMMLLVEEWWSSH